VVGPHSPDPKHDSGPVKPRARTAPALFFGLAAGGLSTVLLAVLNPQSSLIPFFLIYGIAAFLMSVFAARFSPSRLLEVWAVSYVGAMLGIVAEAALHEGLGHGSRNLWPFAVILFVAAGLVPSWLGLWLGKRTSGA
jgi:hypothetical protein